MTDLTMLAELLERATPGPWDSHGGTSIYELKPTHKIVDVLPRPDGTGAFANAALIVAAVNNLPALLARIAELEGALERCRMDLRHAYLTTRALNDADRYGATRAFVAALLAKGEP